MNLIISKEAPWTDTLFSKFAMDRERFICLTEFDEEILEKINPEWIFFFHWSNIINEQVYSKYRCVITHPANLPHGRGGSPIHNQILDGIVFTQQNAIEITEVIDGGGVYCSVPVTLQGNINDIWNTLAHAAYNLILQCVNKNLKPVPQDQFITPYKRKKDNHVIFDDERDINYVYDQIRILDSNQYPNSYVDIGKFRLEFSRAKLNSTEILCDVRISKK